EDIDLGKRNIKQCKRKICDGHYTAAVRVLSSYGVASYNDATIGDLKTKYPSKHAPSLPHISINHHHIIASPTMVLDVIKSIPRGTSCGRDGLRAQYLIDCLSGAAVDISDELVSFITQAVNLFLDGKCLKMLGEYVASYPLIPLVKPGGGIRLIAVGTIWRHLVSKVSASMIGHSLDAYLNDLQFGVGVSRGGEAILHAMNHLTNNWGDNVVLSMLLVDFKNAFNLVDQEVMLQEVRLHCPSISRWVEFCYSSPARLYYGEHTLWSYQVVQQEDIYGDHVVLCDGIVSIKHRHNVVRDTLVDICFRSGISAGKEVDIGHDGGWEKPLHLADMLLYSWDKGLDVCVDLTGSSPLTQTGMVDFVLGSAVIEAVQRKCVKYEAKCVDIGMHNVNASSMRLSV
ncbi:hypothetical protein Tco_1170583, partial [Tanacetum coccineum]